MDHMFITGIKPSSLIIRRTKYSQKMQFDAQIMPEQVEYKGWRNQPTTLNRNQLYMYVYIIYITELAYVYNVHLKY